jgi:hypothetical protein
MLERESEPLVKDALSAGLQALEGVKQLSAGKSIFIDAKYR